MKPTSPTEGGLSSGITQDDRSKSMNSRAFSWGVSSVVTHPLGNGCFPESDGIPPAADAETCPACGAHQKTGDRTPASGQPTTAPAGWQAGRPAVSETGYTIEEP